MEIEWEEIEAEESLAKVVLEGNGPSGEVYRVWYGLVFVNPDVPAMKWVAYGWPEPDSDNLPLFDSCEEAQALCESWEVVRIHAEQLAKALFQGDRSGEG